MSKQERDLSMADIPHLIILASTQQKNLEKHLKFLIQFLGKRT